TRGVGGALGQGDGALTFNGQSTGYVSAFALDNVLPAGNAAYSIETWFNLAAGSNDNAHDLVGWGSDVHSHDNVLATWGPHTLRTYWTQNNLEIGDLPDLRGHWHHAVATYDGTTRKLYIDGALLSYDTPGNGLIVSRAFTLGGLLPHGYLLNGSLDE